MKPKTTALCTFNECGRKHESRGYCKTHARQLRTTGRVWKIGSVQIVSGSPMEDRIAIWKERSTLNSKGCWLWQRCKNGEGYASVTYQRRNFSSGLLHKLVWEHYNGPVPDGLELDHTCRNRNCWNPDHLEPVTHQVNNRRGYWGQKTHCPQGHAYTIQNTRIERSGSRRCKQCSRAHSQLYRDQIRSLSL